MLNKELERSQVVLEEMGTGMRVVAEELRVQSKERAAQATILNAEGQIIRQQNEVLVTIVDEVQVGADHLLENERILQAEAIAAAKSLKKYSEVIAHSTEEVSGIGEAAAQFSRTVQEIQQSTEGFSQATNRFSLFVNELALAGSSSVADTEDDESDSLDEDIAALKEQNDLQKKEIDLLSSQNAEFDAIIEQWTAMGRKFH